MRINRFRRTCMGQLTERCRGWCFVPWPHSISCRLASLAEVSRYTPEEEDCRMAGCRWNIRPQGSISRQLCDTCNKRNEATSRWPTDGDEFATCATRRMANYRLRYLFIFIATGSRVLVGSQQLPKGRFIWKLHMEWDRARRFVALNVGCWPAGRFSRLQVGLFETWTASARNHMTRMKPRCPTKP